jgi:hypothetical protein
VGFVFFGPRRDAIVSRRSRDHAAVFAAFTVAAILIGLFPTDRVANFVAAMAAIYALWYASLGARRVFGDSWARTIAKLFLVIAPYLALLSLTSLLIFAYAVFQL